MIYQPNQKAHSSDEPSTIVHVYIYNYIYLLYYVQYVLYIIYTMNTHNTYLYIYSILSICISIYVHNVEFILIATPELVSTQNPTIVSNSTLGCSLPINQHVWSPPIKQHPSGQSDFLDLTTNGKPMENLSHIKSHEPHSKSHKSNFWCCCSLFGGENLLMDLDLLGGYHYELGITYYVFVHTYIYIYIYIYGKCLGFARNRNHNTQRIIIIILIIITMVIITITIIIIVIIIIIIIIIIKPLVKIFNECRS